MPFALHTTETYSACGPCLAFAVGGASVTIAVVSSSSHACKHWGTDKPQLRHASVLTHLHAKPAHVLLHLAWLTHDMNCVPLVQIKQTLIGTGLFSDTVPCHLASGLGAGFVAVCIGSPVDVVKSRMMGAFCLCGCVTTYISWSIRPLLVVSMLLLHAKYGNSSHDIR